MKKIFVFAFAAFMIGFAASCSKEVLEPTNMEKDWAKNIDLSNSYVKDLYEKTGVAILTEFDDTTDVFYQGAEYGITTMGEITHVAPEQKDAAIKWLKENILDCFSYDCIRKYFPRRIFVCANLKMFDTPDFSGGWINELRYTNNLWDANGVQHAYPYAQGFAVNVNMDVLGNTETTVDYNHQYRVDIMNLLCDELFENNNWMDVMEFDPELFPEDVTMLYGHGLLDKTYSGTDANGDYYVKEGDEGCWNMWYGGWPATDVDMGDPITMCDKSRMSLEGYFQFGFPDDGQYGNMATTYGVFHWPTGTETTYSSKNNPDKETREYSCDGYVSLGYYTNVADSKHRDARNLISALCDLQDVKLTVYGDFLIDRLCIFSDYMKDFGVDFKKFSPSVVKMYQMHEE